MKYIAVLNIKSRTGELPCHNCCFYDAGGEECTIEDVPGFDCIDEIGLNHFEPESITKKEDECNEECEHKKFVSNIHDAFVEYFAWYERKNPRLPGLHRKS